MKNKKYCTVEIVLKLVKSNLKKS